MEIEARHLRLVRTIADTGSISKAAPVLGSTQPALTRQLRRIEEALGGELFTRSRDGVEPTSLGRLVIGRADAVLCVIDSLQSDVAAAATANPAQVRVGVRYGQALLGLMHGLREMLPDSEVVTHNETNIGALTELVAGGRLELAVIHEFVGFELSLDPNIVSTRIGSEPAFVLLSETHPLADRTEIELAELADDHWLLSPLDVDRELDCMASICADAGFRPKIRSYLTDTLGFELVRVGEAVTLCSPVAQHSGTVIKPLVGAPLWVRQLLLTERNSPMVEHLDKLAAYIGEAAERARRDRPVYAAWLERHAAG